MKDTGKVNIHGKEYLTVAYRVAEFRRHHPDWTIVSDLISADETTVLMRSQILDADGRILASGYAEENRKASKINSTSAVENAETSAVGRALAFLGFGGSEIASADEVQQAIRTQEAMAQPDPKITQRFEQCSSIADLQALWTSLPKEQLNLYTKIKDQMKNRIQEQAA